MAYRAAGSAQPRRLPHSRKVVTRMNARWILIVLGTIVAASGLGFLIGYLLGS